MIRSRSACAGPTRSNTERKRSRRMVRTYRAGGATASAGTRRAPPKTRSRSCWWRPAALPIASAGNTRTGRCSAAGYRTGASSASCRSAARSSRSRAAGTAPRRPGNFRSRAACPTTATRSSGATRSSPSEKAAPPYRFRSAPGVAAESSDFHGEAGLEPGGFGRIAARVADHPGAAHAVVEKRVRVSVDPQRRAPHHVLEIENEPGVGAMASIAGRDRARVRREVRDDHGFPREGRGERCSEPPAVPRTERDRVLRREGAGPVADQLIVGIEPARGFDHRGTLRLRRKGVIGPQGAAEKTNAVDHGFAAIEQLDRALARRRSHVRLHRFELALVILVVAGEIEHGLLESLSCPLDPRRAVGYVPREHGHVGVVCGGKEGREFQVEVGIDPDAQTVSVRGEERPGMIARFRAARGARALAG